MNNGQHWYGKHYAPLLVRAKVDGSLMAALRLRWYERRVDNRDAEVLLELRLSLNEPWEGRLGLNDPPTPVGGIWEGVP